MIKIYSKIKKKKLLHLVCNSNKIKKKRVNISNDKEFLQIALLNIKKEGTFDPHKHIWKSPRFKKTIAQESWCVLEGKVLFFAYDIDGKLISKHTVKKGEFTVTYEGGHTYKSLSSNTKVLEYKTGPYEGIKRDKVFL